MIPKMVVLFGRMGLDIVLLALQVVLPDSVPLEHPQKVYAE